MRTVASTGIRHSRIAPPGRLLQPLVISPLITAAASPPDSRSGGL